MTVAVALISAALALGPLPERGLVLETKAGVQLQSLGGRPLGALPGMNLALDQAIAHKAVVRDRRGRLFTFGRRGLRATSFRRGCRTTDVRLTVCRRTIRGANGVLTGAPGKIGHWVWAARSPSGNAILAQWSAECEIPVAYLLMNGELQAFGRESVALGWLATGEAVVYFPNGPCAGDSQPVRGIYSAQTTSKIQLMLRTKRFAQYLMWGG